MRYYASGLPMHSSEGESAQNRKYNGKEFIEAYGLDEYDSQARHYYPAIARTTTMDPLAEKYYSISPYAWCANNPVNLVDLNGMDWYEDEEGHIIYTDLTSQDELDEAGISGTYLGEAYVVFDGSDDESWGDDNTLSGENANPAHVTIYGINGEDDIQYYFGMSTPQSSQYSTINEGDYLAYYEDMATSVYGEAGALQKGSPPALTYRIQTLEGNTELEGTRYDKPITMTGVFMHRTNWNGNASKSSKGCLIIDGRDWRKVEKQLRKSSKIHIRIKRA